MPDKKSVHRIAVNKVQSRFDEIQREFDALQESLLSETKSSAGDKHETGRAMTQLEQEKLSRQLTETRRTLEGLHQIDPDKSSTRIAFGSLVKTNRGYFFISVGIGAITVNDESVFCITAGSPLGQTLLHKSAGETIELNGRIEILEVS